MFPFLFSSLFLLVFWAFFCILPVYFFFGQYIALLLIKKKSDIRTKRNKPTLAKKKKKNRGNPQTNDDSKLTRGLLFDR